MAERAVADAEAALRVAEDDLIARGKGPVEEDVEQLQANVDGLRTKRDRLQGECDVLQTGIDNDAALHRQAEADRANAAQDPNLRVAEARVRAARLLLDLARDTKATHATFVRPRLQDTMNDHYWTFKGDRRVMVTEDWQILAVDEMPDGTEVPVRPSQSETNLLCFAFAAATARLIPQFRLAGDANIPGADHAAAAGTYPLAVDAPLASFEDDYKRGVVDALPESLDQVVLMNGAVDLHHFEEMRINGSIGKAYAVRYTGPLKDLPGGREVNTSFEFADQEITYLENGPPELKRSEILELDVGS
jgi:hypothetical protein